VDNDWFSCADDDDRRINVNLTCDFHWDCDNGRDEIDCSKYSSKHIVVSTVVNT